MSGWWKSSYSNPSGNCVETRWAKSSYSDKFANCAEARLDGVTVLVRDSKDPGPVLAFGREAWAAFLAGVKAGRMTG